MEKIEGEFYSTEYTFLGFSTVRGTFEFVVPKNVNSVEVTTNLNYTGWYQPKNKTNFEFTYTRNEQCGTGNQTVLMPGIKCRNRQLNQTIEFSSKLVKKTYISGTYFSSNPNDIGTFSCKITEV